MALRTQQMRTMKMMNMHVCNGWDCVDNMWPYLKPCHTIPNGLTHFEVASSWSHPDDFVHFHIDDYRFERLWSHPESYVDILKRYSGAIAPDFSTYTDMPRPMQMWNVYRSRALAHFWQTQGIEVVPLIQLSGEDSFGWIFDGLPKHSVLATSSVGVYKAREHRELFAKGMELACKILEPKDLIWYGHVVDIDTNGARIHAYENSNDIRFKANRERADKTRRKRV